MDTLNKFCVLKQTKPDLQYSPVATQWGTSWECKVRVPGCHLVTTGQGDDKQAARENAVRDFVKELAAQGLTKGALGKATKGLGKASLPQAPSWALAGAGGTGIIKDAEPPAKYQKGDKKGKGKGKKKSDGNAEGPVVDGGVLGQMMDCLRTGQAREALDVIHKRYGFACPQIMSVKQFAQCASSVGIRSKEADVMRFFRWHPHDGSHQIFRHAICLLLPAVCPVGREGVSGRWEFERREDCGADSSAPGAAGPMYHETDRLRWPQGWHGDRPASRSAAATQRQLCKVRLDNAHISSHSQGCYARAGRG